MGWRELNARWRRLQRRRQAEESDARFRAHSSIGQQLGRQRGEH
jgi:hypothetical protein